MFSDCDDTATFSITTEEEQDNSEQYTNLQGKFF